MLALLGRGGAPVRTGLRAVRRRRFRERRRPRRGVEQQGQRVVAAEQFGGVGLDDQPDTGQFPQRGDQLRHDLGRGGGGQLGGPASGAVQVRDEEQHRARVGRQSADEFGRFQRAVAELAARLPGQGPYGLSLGEADRVDGGPGV
ncbi:hypothetical protein, partial [Kitasatospora sp. NPDC057198]|uniref:hypothetical protein n=1 Tax=Kitasatospora sp. NPDC057198 TaxID=3346046 RepID=UPI003628176A